MKRNTPEYAALTSKVLEARKNGATIAKIRADFDLNAQEVAWITYTQHITAEMEQALSPGTAPIPAEVAYARNELKMSWGMIMVVGNWTEGAVRKAYEAGTGNLTEGLRNGHGGRFLRQDGVLYADELKPIGTTFKVGERSTINNTDARRSEAHLQKVQAMTPEGAKKLAELRKIDTKGKSHAQIQRALLEDLGAAPARKRAAKKAPAQKRTAAVANEAAYQAEVAAELRATEAAADQAGEVA